MRKLGLLCLQFVLAMFASCVMAWTSKTMWDWFCASTLGVSPSTGFWFGVNIILGLLLAIEGMGLEKKKDTELFVKPLSIVLSCLLTLATGWLFGTIFGWMA